MTKTILPSSKSTFQWYLDNLNRIAFYGISSDDLGTLRESIENIEAILNRLEVKENLDEISE